MNIDMLFEKFRHRYWLIAILFLLVIVLAKSALSKQPVEAEQQLSRQGLSTEIRDYLLSDSATAVPADVLSVLRAPNERDFLNRIYSLSHYTPLWRERSQARRLISQIENAAADGLDQNDYHLKVLNKLLLISQPSRNDNARLDILLTDAFARLAYHLRFGKANPYEIDPNWNFSRELVTDDPVKWLKHAIDNKQIEKALSWLRPRIPSYQALKRTLAHYKALAQSNPWGSVAAGETLKPGMTDDRVPGLRARLLAGGYLTEVPGVNSGYFGEALENGVRRFQRDHGLEEDGAVGRDTIAELNVPVTKRIEQLQVNLERIRWLFRDIGDDFVLVNIAAFQAMYVAGGKVAWRAKAIVGRPYRQTPSFKATLTHLIFNPTWTVPPTILKNDILPAVRKEPAYLRKKNIRVLGPDGVEVDANTIDWATVRARNFPYVLRQDPGESNALGRVKFMFPNKHLVYLHDTPSKSLFERAERTFSSGCIRIERPFELATTLLNHNVNWTPNDITALVESAHTQRVDLDRPIPVLLVYLTAFVADDGSVQFRRDIYSRDDAILARLAAPFKFSPPQGYSLPEKAR
ncbi:MAG: L,D-transpeptidase family protein [Gammaproteobacteria bacterium]